jgi:hypothetical protein
VEDVIQYPSSKLFKLFQARQISDIDYGEGFIAIACIQALMQKAEFLLKRRNALGNKRTSQSMSMGHIDNSEPYKKKKYN